MHAQDLEKQNWKQLSSVQVGGAICMPMLLVGFELARASLQTAFLAIIIGNLFLFLLALVCSQMSYESPKTTAENASLYFGKWGKRLFAAIIALSMCAWFAIQSQVMAQDLALALPQVGVGLLAAIISALIVLSTIKGINALAKLAAFAVPLMVITLLVSIGFAYQNQTEVVQSEVYSAPGDLFKGISLVIAASILAVVDLPTFFRHAATRGDALKASVATFLVGEPLVELAGALLGHWTKSATLCEALACFSHPLWNGWVWLFILLAGWTTNNTNLYSGAMSLNVLLPKFSKTFAVVAAGTVALLFSCFDILSNLTAVLEIMGVSVVSMGAVVLSCYFFSRHFGMPLHEKLQVLSWLCGCTWGLMHLFGIAQMTPMAIVDAALVSVVMILLTWRFGDEKSLATTRA